MHFLPRPERQLAETASSAGAKGILWRAAISPRRVALQMGNTFRAFGVPARPSVIRRSDSTFFLRAPHDDRSGVPRQSLVLRTPNAQLRVDRRGNSARYKRWTQKPDT